MLESVFGGEKLPQVERDAIAELVKRLNVELGQLFEMGETPDTITISRRDADGKERAEVFTKVGGKLPVGNSWYPMERVIEARLRYPEEELSEALKKLEKSE